MRYSKMIGYVVGCAGLLVVGAAFAKDPPQTPKSVASAPTEAACIDSPRGRTHVLRICGDRHYWFKVRNQPTASGVAGLGAAAGLSAGGGPGTVGAVSVNLNR